MKTRAKILLTIAASALTTLAPVRMNAAEAQAPVEAPSPSDPEKQDTVVSSATRTLIESFGELSRTAAKLSDTALKLLEMQEKIKAEKSSQPETGTKPTAKKKDEKKTTSKNQPEKNTESALKEIVEEINVISSELIPGKEQKPDDNEKVVNSSVVSVEEAEDSDNASSKVYISDEVREEKPADPSIWILPGEKSEGGKYMWIPDENISMVEAVMNGDKRLAGEINTIVDLNEKTFWRGDSIPMAIHTRRIGRYDRKLYNWLIYPRGLWHISLSANYGELSTDDSEFLTLIQDVNLKGKIYSIKPSVSYFFRNNICAGMRLAFTKGDMAINSFKFDIDDDLNFNLHDIKYTSESYSAAIFLQQFFGLSRRGRFAVYNEAELSFGTGNSHFIRPFGGELIDTRTKFQTFNINYSPGVSIMVMKYAAFNVSFGVLGFHLKNEKQWDNGEESGKRLTSGVQFRFNIFNINFGVSIII